MQFTIGSLALALGLAASVAAHPSAQLDARTVQTVHLTFHAGPVEYSLAIPADGSIHETNSDLSVNIIDTPDYNAINQCHFTTDSAATLVGHITETGLQQIIVGPPQPIRKVSCQGMCVPTYGDCYVNGQPTGPCCSGFCAANKCRPWVYPGA